MLEPRPYQIEALKAVMERYRAGISRQLISLPTGCGKTIIFGLVAAALKTRTLILAHREELLQQAQQKIKFVYPDADTGIFQAKERSGLNSEICIASVQTATLHTEELRARGFNLLICDEAHHAVSNSYRLIFNDLGFSVDNPEKLLLGVTATAFRGDNLALGEVFKEIVFERSIAAMIKGGYLCPPKGIQVGTDIDISDVRVQQGDFDAAQLERVINTDERNGLIVESYIKHGYGRHGVIFTVSIAHALALARTFKECGVTCEAVYCSMRREERQKVLADYENHKLQMLTNVGVLTEGWDVPDTDIIIMARPTKSKVLYIQCIGRGLRIAPNKSDCLIIDLVDVTRQHDLCRFGTLFEELKVKDDYEDEEDEEAIDGYNENEESSGKKPRDSTLVLAPETCEIDLFQTSQYVWEGVKVNYKLPLLDGSALWCRAVGGGYSPIFVQNNGVIELSKEILPLGYAMGVCEDYARRLKISSYSQKNAAWRNKKPTEKQLETLRNLGIDFSPDISKGEASQLLSARMSESATEKQIWLIATKNLHPAPQFLTKREAGKIISEYKERQVN